jgi:hypothetical protein
MKKVYISSTYKDLVEYREAAAVALRQIGHEVICMEEYVARDERTLEACEGDVARCDIYVGIFAWRYGHVPTDDNEGQKSITELEYRKACEDERKTRLVFLLADEAPWPSTLRDAETGEEDRGERIRELRAELKKRCAGYFLTPDELAKEVIAAVYQNESRMRVEQLSVLDEIKESIELGPSYLANIQQKIVAAQDAEIVEIRLGLTPWWTTRLHLVAALAADYTRIRQFVFLDAEGLYVTMASPTEVRRALTQQFPELERLYLESRISARAGGDAGANEVDLVVELYPELLIQAFGGKPERDVKQDVSPVMLRRELAIEPSADTVERGGERSSLLQWEILRRDTPFVAETEEGRLVSVIDRVQMASNIAVQILEQHLR